LLPLYKGENPAQVLPFIKGRQRGFDMALVTTFLGSKECSDSKPDLRLIAIKKGRGEFPVLYGCRTTLA
jgi:hypothetical protein